jgi:hypothetical protein
MERLSNSVLTAIQLWQPVNTKTPEDGSIAFSEALARNGATRYEVPENLNNCHRRESKPKDSVLRTLTSLANENTCSFGNISAANTQISG